MRLPLQATMMPAGVLRWATETSAGSLRAVPAHEDPGIPAGLAPRLPAGHTNWAWAQHWPRQHNFWWGWSKDRVSLCLQRQTGIVHEKHFSWETMNIRVVFPLFQAIGIPQICMTLAVWRRGRRGAWKLSTLHSRQAEKPLTVLPSLSYKDCRIPMR